MDENLMKLQGGLKDLQNLNSALAPSSTTPGTANSLFMGFSMYGLFFGFIFSMVGLGFFRYGKKNDKLYHMIIGIILMIYPYFVTNPIYIVLIGLIFSFSPLALKRFL